MREIEYTPHSFALFRLCSNNTLFWIWVGVQSFCVVALFTVNSPVFAVSVLLTILFGIAIVMDPRASFLAISIVTFMIHPDVISKEYVVKILGVNWYSMDWILFFSLLSAFFLFCLGRLNPLPKTALTLPLLVFLCLLPIAAFSCIQQGNQFQDVFADFRLFFYYIGFFLVLAFARSEKDLEFVFWSTIICGLVGALPEIVNSLTGSMVDSMTGQRLDFGRITGPHEVNFPIQLVGSIAMLPFASSFQKRCTLVLAALVASVAMGLSYARGSWLAAAFGLIVVILLMLRFAPSVRRVIIRVAVALFLIFSILLLLDTLGFFSFQAFTDRATLVSTERIDVSSLARLSEWQKAISVFLSKPLLGAGLGYIFHFYAVGIGEVSQIFVHNSYIYVLSKMGLVGFIAFVFLFGCALSLAYRTLKKEVGGTRMGLMISYVSMLCVLLAKSLTTWHLNVLTSSLYVGLLLGAIAVISSWTRRSSAVSSSSAS
jgi:O-antigen ligase